MGAIKDMMKEVLLLNDKIDRAGQTLSEISNELRDHDLRLIRLETMLEFPYNDRKLNNRRNDLYLNKKQ